MNHDPHGQSWQPETYGQFSDERSRPFFDLLALVRPEPNMRVVDLGSGTGELTRVLHDRLRAKSTVGYERSDAMLAKSAPHANEALRFERADVATVSIGEVDLIFSNAAMHWGPAHDRVLARLATSLAPKGQLAVQVPANFDYPSHTVAAEVASEPPFAGALAGSAHRAAVFSPEYYARMLHEMGFREQRVRLEVYVHLLPSRQSVVEWVKGSLLTDYRERLSRELYDCFLEAYTARLMTRLSDERPFFYPFKRILMWGTRKG